MRSTVVTQRSFGANGILGPLGKRATLFPARGLRRHLRPHWDTTCFVQGLPTRSCACWRLRLPGASTPCPTPSSRPGGRGSPTQTAGQTCLILFSGRHVRSYRNELAYGRITGCRIKAGLPTMETGGANKGTEKSAHAQDRCDFRANSGQRSWNQMTLWTSGLSVKQPGVCSPQTTSWVVCVGKGSKHFGSKWLCLYDFLSSCVRKRMPAFWRRTEARKRNLDSARFY